MLIDTQSDHGPERSSRAAMPQRTGDHARNLKACMAISWEELKALRQHANRSGAKSISDFMRRNFPPQLLQPPVRRDGDTRN